METVGLRPEQDTPPAYAELHCLSNFSFLRGASHPEELVARARALGYAALAFTDECSLAGVVRAHRAARETNLKLLIGSEFTLAEGTRLVLLAPDRDAYGQLAELITEGRCAAAKGSYRLRQSDVERQAQRCLALWIPRDPFDEAEARAELEWLGRVFAGHAWIAVELLRDGRDPERLAALRALGVSTGLPLVAAGDVHMHERARRPLQDVLTAIRRGETIA
ncbi:MAG TPA: PHP domain-containing protein, partial [Myxococcota bacterium]|nr:PHP domain-containing protein [Myxococcota bacterium]